MRRIEDVQTLRAELHVDSLSHVEPAEETDIGIDDARTAEYVKPRVSESRIGDGLERCPVVVSLAGPCSAQLVHRANLVGPLRIARHIQRGAIGTHGER